MIQTKKRCRNWILLFAVILIALLGGAGCSPASSDVSSGADAESTEIAFETDETETKEEISAEDSSEDIEASRESLAEEESAEEAEGTLTVQSFPAQSQPGSSRPAESVSAPATSAPTSSKETAAVSGTTAAKPSASAKPSESAKPSVKPSESAKPSAEPSTAAETEAAELRVTISVNWSNAIAADNDVAKMVAPDGVVLAETAITLTPGQNVYDALQATGLVIGSRNSVFGAYIFSIQSLGEKDCGSNSGWMYKVNGVIASTGCSNYILQNGDVIEWVYTCDGGKDVQ